MKLDPITAPKRFGIRDLGVLEGPPLRTFETVIELVRAAFGAPMSAFFVFDDDCGTAHARAWRGLQETPGLRHDLPIANSLCSEVRHLNKTVHVVDVTRLEIEPPERPQFGAVSFLGSPVFGPAGDTVGVLAAMFNRTHYWAEAEVGQQEKLAQLLTQQILLRACLETLRLIAKERRIAAA